MDWTALTPAVVAFASGAIWFAYNLPEKMKAVGPWAFYGVVAVAAAYTAWLAGVDMGRTDMLSLIPDESRAAAVAAFPVGSISPYAILVPTFAACGFVLFLLWVTTLKREKEKADSRDTNNNSL